MNPRTDGVELAVVAETEAEVRRIGRRRPTRRTQACGTVQPEREGARAAEEPGADSFLFDDPYWDDAFDSYHDPTLRTCCRF